jgi:hypothetical protein
MERPRRTEKSLFKSLPTEILGIIGSNIDPEKLFELCDTEPDVKRLCNDESYWKRRISQEFGISNLELNKFVTTWKPTNETNAQFLTNFFYYRSGGPRFYKYPQLDKLVNIMEELNKLISKKGSLPNIPEIQTFISSIGKINIEDVSDKVSEEIIFRDELGYRAEKLRERRIKLRETDGKFDNIIFKLPAPENLPDNRSELKTLLDNINIKIYLWNPNNEDIKRLIEDEVKLKYRLESVKILAKEGDLIKIFGQHRVYFIYGNETKKLANLLMDINSDNLYLPKEAEKFVRRKNIQDINSLEEIYPDTWINITIVGLEDRNNELIRLTSLDDPHKERKIYGGEYIVIVPPRADERTVPLAPRKVRVDIFGKSEARPSRVKRNLEEEFEEAEKEEKERDSSPFGASLISPSSSSVSPPNDLFSTVRAQSLVSGENPLLEEAISEEIQPRIPAITGTTFPSSQEFTPEAEAEEAQTSLLGNPLEELAFQSPFGANAPRSKTQSLIYSSD